MCAGCNDLIARRAAAKVHGTLAVLRHLYGSLNLQALTTTLPGSWHGIRSASIFKQYAYLNARVPLPGTGGGLWPKRGLNKRLQDAGVLGGWHFFECTYNDRTGCWNAHFHSLIVGDCSSWLPVSEQAYDVVSTQGRYPSSVTTKHPLSSTSGKLRSLGYGERYTLDQIGDADQLTAYVSEFAYCSKQNVKGPSRALATWLRVVKPRLVSPFGIARVSDDDRIACHLENDEHDLADMLQSKQDARREMTTGTVAICPWLPHTRQND